MKIYQGDLRAPSGRFAVLCSRFNGLIVESLKAGAVDTLQRHGVQSEDIDLIWVPGAFELPLAARKLAASRRYVAIVALGTVIRGATPHFDYVAGECAKGLAAVALEHQIPIGFGVLTTESIEQALERAGTKAGNKGVDAALSALEMSTLLQQLEA